MTLTESELLQARIAEMSSAEFDEWLESYSSQAYNDGKVDADNLNTGWEDGYEVGYEEGKTDHE